MEGELHRFDPALLAEKGGTRSISYETEGALEGFEARAKEMKELGELLKNAENLY